MTPDAAEAYRTSPRDWGRWGKDDEIGRANLLDAAAVLGAARCIRVGKRFSLALPLSFDDSDPGFPGREPPRHRMVQHEGSYRSGAVAPLAGGYQFTDDRIELSCHGTTHVDALGHAYVDSVLWNGRPADSTGAGLGHADVAALAARGIVGRAVLADVARARDQPYLPRGHVVTVDEVEAALRDQQTELTAGDTLILRTGNFAFFCQDPERYYADFAEPGLGYSPEAVEFFRRHDLAGLGSDTLCNEQAHSVQLGSDFPMHVLLQRNLGVVFHEALWLEEWADDSAADGVFDAFYTAAPLRLRGCSGAPVNPLVIK